MGALEEKEKETEGEQEPDQPACHCQKWPVLSPGEVPWPDDLQTEQQGDAENRKNQSDRRMIVIALEGGAVPGGPLASTVKGPNGPEVTGRHTQSDDKKNQHEHAVLHARPLPCPGKAGRPGGRGRGRVSAQICKPHPTPRGAPSQGLAVRGEGHTLHMPRGAPESGPGSGPDVVPVPQPQGQTDEKAGDGQQAANP